MGRDGVDGERTQVDRSEHLDGEALAAVPLGAVVGEEHPGGVTTTSVSESNPPGRSAFALRSSARNGSQSAPCTSR